MTGPGCGPALLTLACSVQARLSDFDAVTEQRDAMRRQYEEQVGALQEQLAASADESRLSESKVDQLEEEVSALHAQLESLLDQSNALQKDKSASDDAVRKQQSELINLRTQLLQRGDSDGAGAPQSFLLPLRCFANRPLPVIS